MRLRNGCEFRWPHLLVTAALFLAGAAFGFGMLALETWVMVRFLQWIGAL